MLGSKSSTRQGGGRRQAGRRQAVVGGRRLSNPAAGMRNVRTSLPCMRMLCMAVKARAAFGSCTPALYSWMALFLILRHPHMNLQGIKNLLREADVFSCTLGAAAAADPCAARSARREPCRWSLWGRILSSPTPSELPAR